MTDTTRHAADNFENLLLEQAQLCHDELKASFKAMRGWEQFYRDKLIGYDEMVTQSQRELLNVRQFVEDTAHLAGMAARLRGQNIRVTRAAEPIAEKAGERGAENGGSIPQQNIPARPAAALKEAAE